MATYHVSTSEISGEIYAGTLKADGQSWRDKTDVTDLAILAVRDHLVDKMKQSGQDWYGYEWTQKDGKRVVLMSVKVD